MSRLAETYATEFPVRRELIYFNHAGVCPLPVRSAQAAQAVLELQVRRGAADYGVWTEGLRQVRASAARLLKAHDDEIAFVKNTSQGLLLAAGSIPWEEGDNVVTSAIEFPANIYPWLMLDRFGVETRLVGARQGRVLIDDLAAAMDDRTRCLAISWVQFSTGYRSDLGKLSQLCRDHDAYLVLDAIQGLGALRLDLSRYGVDFAAADGHKWLLGVEGAGLLYVRRQILDRLQPFNVGWLSVERPYEFLDYQMRLAPTAARFEEGSPNVAGLHALGASLDLLLEAGPEAVEQAVLTLTDELAEGVTALGCEVVSPRGAGETSGILNFRHPRLESHILAHRLRRQGVECVERTGAVRFSPHFYNDHSEVERALAILQEALVDHQE